MTCVSYTDLRQNLAHYLDEAVNSRAPIIVTRKTGKGSVVLMSEEEFSGWQETVHLLSSHVTRRGCCGAFVTSSAGQRPSAIFWSRRVSRQRESHFS